MPRISDESIERVAHASDIVEVIGSYFPLKRAGTAWKALCPFHSEKTPSFTVNPQRQSFHCFGCHAGGSVFKFIMNYENVDFPTAVRRLAQRAGIPLIEEEGGPDADRSRELRHRLLAIHAATAQWCHNLLLKSPDATAARDYLKSRGISISVAKSWQIGFAPDSWDAMIVFLRDEGFTMDDIAASGLTSSSDEDTRPGRTYARFRGRVMFPICNDYGEVIAFSGRVLDPEAKTAKYVNSPESPLFTKGRVLFGLDKSKRALIEARSAVVCEGQLDLITAYEAGIRNVIAPQGTAFTTDQARLLRRFVDEAVLCFDSDRAGLEAVTRSLPALFDNGLSVRVVELPDGSDPDAFIRSEGPDAFQARIKAARGFFEHAIDRMARRGALNDPAGTTAAARKLGPFIALIDDPVLRDATAKTVSVRLGIAESALATHIKRSNDHRMVNATDSVPAAAEPLALSEGIRQLCRLAILSPDAREWLATQSTPPLATLAPGSELLARIVASAHNPFEPAGRALLASSLPPAMEAAFVSLDLDRPDKDPVAQTQNLWIGLASAKLRDQIDTARTQLRDPTLTTNARITLLENVSSLSKQILDLQSRLNDL